MRLFRSALPFGVLLVLILTTAGCASQRDLAGPDAEALRAENARLRADLATVEAERDEMRARIGELEYQLSLQSTRSGERGQTVALLPTDIFFESGSAELTEAGAFRLVEVAERLRAEYPGRTIRIEGYTDSQPIGPALQAQYPSNWELSAARAATVARHLQWTHDFDGAQIEVVGLSQYHPQATNATAEGREQNRRVRIAVMAD